MEWNSKEKKELIKLYPKYTAKELEVKFKRSSKAIHRMANLLGIYKTANKVPPGLYDVGLRFMIVHCRVRADNTSPVSILYQSATLSFTDIYQV